MWKDWPGAFIVLVGFLIALLFLLRRTKPNSRKLTGTSAIVALGTVFAMIFDPKSVQASEQIQKVKEIGCSDEGESGDKPLDNDCLSRCSD